MTIGLDTTALIAFELLESPGHARVRSAMDAASRDGSASFALTPQVLLEFVHVVTDERRFESPLSMQEALRKADEWWNCSDVIHCHTDDQSTRLFFEWMLAHRLGRKRILDTQLAAIYHSHGIQRLATANPADFHIFGTFQFEPWCRW